MGNQIKVDSRGYETRPKGKAGFPVVVGKVAISIYEDRRFLPHWHSEPEITLILEGEMDYRVNDTTYHLTAGQAIYVNSNCLHSGWNEEGECIYAPLNFAPSMLFKFDESRIYKKYVEPIMRSDSFVSYVFDPETSENDRAAIGFLTKMLEEKQRHHDCYELDIMANLCSFWAAFAPIALGTIESSGGLTETKQMARIKKAVDYIDGHYREDISLSDLSILCGLSRSEFCRSFKSVMKRTPIEYLTGIRIRKSLPLLASGEYSITEIAELCGFSGPSYFSEMFRRHMSCSPSYYAKYIG